MIDINKKNVYIYIYIYTQQFNFTIQFDSTIQFNSTIQFHLVKLGTMYIGCQASTSFADGVAFSRQKKAAGGFDIASYCELN